MSYASALKLNSHIISAITISARFLRLPINFLCLMTSDESAHIHQTKRQTFPSKRKTKKKLYLISTKTRSSLQNFSLENLWHIQIPRGLYFQVEPSRVESRRVEMEIFPFFCIEMLPGMSGSLHKYFQLCARQTYVFGSSIFIVAHNFFLFSFSFACHIVTRYQVEGASHSLAH